MWSEILFNKKLILPLIIVGLLVSSLLYSLDLRPTIHFQGESLWMNETSQCHFGVFKKYVANHSFFPSEGKWARMGNRTVFQPKICTFQYAEQPPVKYLTQCLQRKSLRKFLVLGDSNGLRYFEAFQEILGKSGFVCNTTRTEHHEPDPKYFGSGFNKIPMRQFLTHKRDCGHCKSATVQCISKKLKSVVVQVEYIVMELYMDTEIHTFRSYKMGNCPPPPNVCEQSDTNQEMIFSEYLRGNYPDVILLFGNNHFHRHALYKSKNAITTLANILVNYTPDRTTVVWATTASENESRKPARYRGAKFKEGKYTYTTEEMIHITNQAVFDTLKPLIIGNRLNILPFMDLQKVSDAVVAKWSLDGVHLVPFWYQLMTSYILQSLCN